uniref:Myosin VIIA and Rab interacting protein b n=1 Tax=Callorhinchus milii TaxID=7868 RepID=A0A4W3H9W1_CALMI|eukprot:gi/632958504/ref/XP_007895074.1/ PREDICTED: rab effector MyRIP [Callorhinchus milii]
MVNLELGTNTMGKKLDLSGLTDDEAEHVLKVVQRDFDLRKKEQDRLSELKQKLSEEGNKRSILSKQEKFNETCCIRCCRPFTFLINTKRPCLDCKFNICKNCGTYSKKDKIWICTVCQQTRLLRTQSLEWYYNNVRGRFKHFGSAKVVQTLFKKRLAERGCQSDLLEGSILDGSQENEDSICGSDSTFYRQSEGHTMTETLSVALRVAEEAVEEAITKAESFSDCLEKQNESRYLREHKEELIEELAATIVQKVIKRKKSVIALTDSESERPHSGNSTSTYQTASKETPLPRRESCTRMPSLWRSHSEFSLTTEETLSKEIAEANLKSTISEVMWKQGQSQPSESADLRPRSLPSWKSLDVLDNNAGSSNMLTSPDGNWIAMLSNTPAARPRLLTKPKSRAFMALESEAEVISAYDEMGTDDDDDDDDDDEIAWSSAVPEFRRLSGKLSDKVYYMDSQHDDEWPEANARHRLMTSPSSGQYTNTETTYSDSETSSASSVKISARGSDEQAVTDDNTQYPHCRDQKRVIALHSGEPDINYNSQAQRLGAVDSSEAEDVPNDSEKRHRRRKRSKCSAQEQLYEAESNSNSRESQTKNTCQELSRCMFDMEQSLARMERRVSLGAWTREEPSIPAHAQIPKGKSDLDISKGTTHTKTHADVMEEKLRSKLVELATKLSDRESSSGDELDQETTKEAREREDTSSSDEDHKQIQDELVRKYSAVSLCNITTEALKVINATEDLIGAATGGGSSLSESRDLDQFPTGKEAMKLEEHLSKLEENVYLTAGTVYSLEGQLNDLEDCARSIHSITTETELADLEDQVATAAAQVHQAELQVSDIERRISALNVAGLNVAPCVRLLKKHNQSGMKPETIDSSRQQRRKLPAPPKQGDVVNNVPVVSIRTFHRNGMFQEAPPPQMPKGDASTVTNPAKSVLN